MTQLTLALAQIDIAFGQPERNYQTVADAVAEAARKKADVVVLPEMWNTGYDLEHLETLADPDGLQTQTFLSDLARHYHLTIVGGSVATAENEHFFNRSLTLDAQGHLLASYAKAHLFRLMNEEKFITAGSEADHFTLTVPASVAICYDLRFPEWFRRMASDGTQLFFLPAEWPTPRLPQFAALLTARAIENQAFVVAVNRVGQDPDNDFGGQSQVIDPFGKRLLQLDDQPQVGTVTIDLDQIAAARQQIPVFTDRRPELY
ncbi:carbon-nitrogen family hydrolase [Lacticaseibacillus zeae]|uniref:Carbon-nitrogen family hydrolase n=1 Tax=Lacticaseibacillus zeae TaxID=57037 RepID=A0A5R8LR47_LACZE|nr:carbon-nitrogen family hydrolase [Lacticaseibacillus zeae]TLF39736.1 carbon-nitrogen family hydrolase [Lacticaseibacillus zeae]